MDWSNISLSYRLYVFEKLLRPLVTVKSPFDSGRAEVAGHSDFSTMRRYVHPQADTIKATPRVVGRNRAGSW